MKRIVSLLLTLALGLGLCACGQKAGATWQEQYDLGVRYLDEGKYEEAIVAFTAAIEIDPKRPEAYIGRGDAYLAGGDEADLSAAQKDYETALDLDDALPAAWLGLAQVYVTRGDVQQALELLEEAAEKTDDREIQDRLEELREETTGEEPEEPRVDSARYEIQRNDLSYYNEAGQVLIALYYDQVVLDGSAFQSINEAIHRDYQDKFPPPDARAEYAQYLDGPYLGPESPFMNTYDAEVTHNGDGIFSIALTQSWYMGGVFNRNVYGLTFDLNTGAEASLSDLMGMDETALVRQLKSRTKAYLDQDPDRWFAEAWDTVESLTLEEFEYYVRDGELILCFETYMLGPGASGCAEVPTGMTIAPGQGQDRPSVPEPAAQVVMEHLTSGSQEYGVVRGLSADGGTMWSYETDRYEMAQLQRVSEIGAMGELYFLVEGGAVVALDCRTGQVRWTNSDFGGAMPAFAWDEDNLYLCGSLGPDLFVVSRTGQTILRAEDLDPEYMWPTEITLEDGQAVISYEGSMTDGYGGPYRLKVDLATLETSRL